MGRRKKVPSISEMPEIPPENKTQKWVVSPGRAVTSKKGILSEGDEVKASFFSGDSPMDRLSEIGIIKLS